MVFSVEQVDNGWLVTALGRKSRRFIARTLEEVKETISRISEEEGLK